jgi:mannose-6-phosphate isomerase-like protein (cupin superfamily)
MSRPVRRVVTATDDKGRSYFLIDGAAGNVLGQPGRGLVFHELWVTGGPLASNEGTADAAAGPVEHHPPHGGSRVRIVEFMPDEKQDAARAAADYAAIGASERLVGDAADPSMHRNDTVDYNIIISGEIYAKTDRGEVLLRPGDVLIQRGTNHTWHNRSSEPCVFASVMVSAAPLAVHAGRK